MAGDQMVYIMLNTRNGYVKIGVSCNPCYRERTLQSEEPQICLFAIAEGGKPIESAIHRQYGDFRLRGEWFHLQPHIVGEIIRRFSFRQAPDERRVDVFRSFAAGQSYEEFLIDQYHRLRADNSRLTRDTLEELNPDRFQIFDRGCSDVELSDLD